MVLLLSRFALLPLLGVGAIALVWARAFSSEFWVYAPLEGIASRIVRSDNLAPDVLDGVAPLINNLEQLQQCLPRATHNAAIIRGRMLQIAIDNSDPDLVAQASASVDTMIRKSLRCAPNDSFLWFVLFWLEGMRGGFSDDLVGYLSKSYELGPYEGWIALRRNKYALIVYPLLPPPLQDRVVSEFAAMVDSGFIRDAASNLMGAGWPVHDKLLASLTHVSLKFRRQLANDLRRAGVEVDVPDVTMPEFRPWQVE
ncbi:hypothetical protein [Bradyrhizobium sp. BR 10289]|uniref:hypothetical protein n=1 Tax=Bradyrhizobium sp. BR 10289 TaxID=2749993 RepID=UPI001C64E253|nr:hypothetical protein [Bradyrhizobium sp. BR 10289]MBW7971552.1 hypothetical protein [Bradyrhizobium sp. BR 10289]